MGWFDDNHPTATPPTYAVNLFGDQREQLRQQQAQQQAMQNAGFTFHAGDFGPGTWTNAQGQSVGGDQAAPFLAGSLSPPAGGGAPGAGGADPAALIRQYQATHPAAGGSSLDDMVAYLQANGVNASRFTTRGGVLSNNELSIPGLNDSSGKYKVFSEGNNTWYTGGDDSGGGGIGAGLATTPGYQFRLGEGLRALQNAAAARGTLLTGGTLKGIQKYAQDVASTEYGNRVNQLMGLSQLGMGAAGGAGTAASAYGRSAGDLLTQQGNAAAAGTVGGANAYANAINAGLQNAQSMYLLSQLGGGGGGGGGGITNTATPLSG